MPPALVAGLSLPDHEFRPILPGTQHVHEHLARLLQVRRNDPDALPGEAGDVITATGATPERVRVGLTRRSERRAWRSCGNAAARSAEFFGTESSRYFLQTSIFSFVTSDGAGFREKRRSIISRWMSGRLIKDLLLDGNLLRSHLARDFHDRPLGMDVGHNLLTQCEDSILVTLLVFVDVDRRNFKGRITFCGDFFVGDVLVEFFDVNHQHMEME
jgi:hypothetical protein